MIAVTMPNRESIDIGGVTALAFTNAVSSNVSVSGTGASAAIAEVGVNMGSTWMYKNPEVLPITALKELPYFHVGATLEKMRQMGGQGQWCIDSGVYAVSTQVLAALSAQSVPAPQIASHGSESVVFTWTDENSSLYLTVGSTSIGVLMSSNDGRRLRWKLPPPNFGVADSFFTAIKYLPLHSQQEERAA
jgi:hypothetical protein